MTIVWNPRNAIFAMTSAAALTIGFAGCAHTGAMQTPSVASNSTARVVGTYTRITKKSKSAAPSTISDGSSSKTRKPTFAVDVETCVTTYQNVSGTFDTSTDPVVSVTCSDALWYVPDVVIIDGVTDANGNPVDCSVNADDPACLLATLPPGAGKGCYGSETYGLVLGANVLGYSDSAHEVNQIFAVYETTAAGGLLTVAYIFTDFGGDYFLMQNGNDSSWLSNLAGAVPVVGAIATSLNAAVIGTWSPPMSSTQAAAFFAKYPAVSTSSSKIKPPKNGSQSCFSAPLPAPV